MHVACIPMGADASRSHRDAAVLLATSRFTDEVDEDEEPLLAALARSGIEARPAIWDDPDVDWAAADLVVIRSTWDYPLRRDDFLDWAERVSVVAELANPLDVLRWNTDKRYLVDLQRAGVPVVHTEFLGPDRSPAEYRSAVAAALDPDGEVVVKPSVSAGSRDTGRFSGDRIDQAVALCERIAAGGRTTMVQPYEATVDDVGETGLVYFEGHFSHAFGKGALLAPVGETEPGLFALERISPATAADDQLAVGDEVCRVVAARFGAAALYARVDLLTSADGSPVLLELELTEPSWFLPTDPGAADRAARAIASQLARPPRLA